VTATVSNAQTSTTSDGPSSTGAAPRCRTASQAAATIASLATNPDVGGTPARAAKPMVIVTNVTGIACRMPPMSAMRLLPTAWINAPAHRNNNALYAAWLSRSATLGTRSASTARPTNMRPSWLIVE
jgi:hypothetical protein